jgi:hypothetical protein
LCSLRYEAIYARYTWVSIAEIFHMANFSINLFLYCLASKLIRKELAARLDLIVNRSCRCACCRVEMNC